MTGTLRFILGRAGTGKTYTCLKEIKETLVREGEDGPALILLVPEQAAFQMEYELYTSMPRSATAKAQVLSFRRLARRVLSQAGGASRPWLGEIGKRMVLRSLIQKHLDDLIIFGRSAGTPGFTESLAGTLAEFKIYNITPNMLAAYARNLASAKQEAPLAGKLHDLALLYSELEEFLAPRYTDPEGYLSLLAARLQEAPIVKEARIWVDGFTGFTPQEFQVLAALMKTATQLSITLCLDAKELSKPARETDLFHPTRETYSKLSAIALSQKTKVSLPLVLGESGELAPRFGLSPELHHLEGRFFNYPAKIWTGPVNHISQVAATNPRVEVEAVAREIVHLVRDLGWRWRDIVLVVRDLESHHNLIATVFGDYDIPCFLDRKRPVLHHPLAKLVLSAWEVVSGGWSYEAVFRCLKTDLLPMDRADVDRLENYVLAYGIRGKTWVRSAPWDFHVGYRGEENWEDIDLLRSQVASWLQPLCAACNEDNLKGLDLSLALWSFIEDLGIGNRLAEWADEASAAGDLELAQEHTQVWTDFLALMDELVVGLGDTALTAVQFAEILASGLEGLRFGLVPPSLDQVLVGSLERSRHPNARAAFVLGVNEGVLPGRISEDTMLNDKEREQLLIAGIELAPTSQINQFHERYLTYIALTRASERLWLSFTLADADGKAMAPSYVITRLRELFPGLKEQYVTAEPSGNPIDDIKFVATSKTAVQHLAGQLRLAKTGHHIDPMWFALQDYLGSGKETAPLIQQAISALKATNQERPLSLPLTRRLYGGGGHNRASATRLERFTACPFQHFSHYGLSLRARQIFGIDLPTLGQFTHTILSQVTKELLASNKSFGDLDLEQAHEIIDRRIQKTVPIFSGGVLETSARYQYLTRRLQRLLCTAVMVLAEQERCGDFRTAYTEVGFGFDGSVLPGLRFSLPGEGQLSLIGQIDRIDLAVLEGQTYFTIVDYKSRSKKLSLSEVYFGLSLQLLLYLLAAADGLDRLGARGAVAAGVFYFALQESFVRSKGPLPAQEAAKAHLKQFRLQGLVRGQEDIIRLLDREGGGTVLAPVLNKDGNLRKGSPAITHEQFQLLLEFAADKVKAICTRLLQGNVEIAPYKMSGASACDYCEFAPICQFDPLLSDNSYRLLPTLTDEQVWSLLASREGDGNHE